MLVVYQPAASKPVGDLCNYVRVTASAAWHVRLDAAAARELDAGSSCWSKRMTYMLQKSPAVSGKLRKVYVVNYGQVMFNDIGDADHRWHQSAYSR